MTITKTISFLSLALSNLLFASAPFANELNTTSAKNTVSTKYDHFATQHKAFESTNRLNSPEGASKTRGSYQPSALIHSYSSRMPSSTRPNDCTVENLYLLSGEQLVSFIAGCEHSEIVQKPLFDINDRTEQLYSEHNMLALAAAIESRSQTYDGTNTQGLAALMLLARAGFYIDFYSDSLNLPSNVRAAFAASNKAYADNENFLNTDEANAAILDEWASLVDGSEDWVANYQPLMAILDIMPFYTPDDIPINGNYLIHSVQYTMWRGHNQNSEFKALFNSDENSASRFIRLVSDFYPFIGTRGENAFFNAIKDLVRLLQHANHIDATRNAVKALLAKWERLSPAWANLVFAVNDSDDCALYDNICEDGIRDELMTKVFPNTFDFDDGKLIIRTAVDVNKAQLLYHAQKQVEAQFKRKNQELTPLASDANDVLTMFVYGTRSDYEIYQPLLFDLDTDNGGIYIESWGQFFTYERTPQESIYSLEELFRHEYVHYLQGRFTAEGNWGDTEMYQNSRLTWFEEGGAEFFAGSTQAEGIKLRKIMLRQIFQDDGYHLTIPEIVTASYSEGFKFYRYGALFFNFLNETQPETITLLHKTVRADNVADFDAIVNGFISDTQMQTAYSAYIKEKLEELDDMADFKPTDFPLPGYLDTDLIEDIRALIIGEEVFALTSCEQSATTINTRFTCSGTVTGANVADLNAQLDAGITNLNQGINNFTTMNCAIGTVTASEESVSAPYLCEGGLREYGSEQLKNQAPVANAGEDQNDQPLREIIQLSGALSTDPENDTLTYSWQQLTGASVTNVDPIGGFDKVSFSFYAYEDHLGQELSFELTVNDGEHSNTDTVSVTIQTAPTNEAPSAYAGEDQTVTSGNTVTLDASGSSDPDGDELTFTWVQIAGPTVSINDDTFNAPQVSSETTLTFELTVNDGELTDTDTVTIIVQTNVSNSAPNANAGNDQTVSSGDTVTLNASGSSDPDDDELTFTWTQVSGPDVSINNGTFTAPQVSAATTLVFQLTADDGKLTDTDTVSVIVNSAETTTPPTTPTAPKESSGGGSVGLFGLVFGLLIGLRRIFRC